MFYERSSKSSFERGWFRFLLRGKFVIPFYYTVIYFDLDSYAVRKICVFLPQLSVWPIYAVNLRYNKGENKISLLNLFCKTRKTYSEGSPPWLFVWDTGPFCLKRKHLRNDGTGFIGFWWYTLSTIALASTDPQDIAIMAAKYATEMIRSTLQSTE